MNLLSFIKFAVLSATFMNALDAYKILGVFPSMYKSHTIIGEALMTGLAKSGHEVTVVTGFSYTKNTKNYTHIDISDIYKSESGNAENLLDLNSINIVSGIIMIYDMGISMTQSILKHPNIEKLLSSNKKFDLVIIECFIDEALLGIAQHFNAPVISMATFGAYKWNTDQVGSPSPLSFVPHSLLSYTDKMTFSQRLGNTLMTIYENLYVEAFYYPRQRKLYETHFPNAKISFDDMQRNVNFVLLNSHFSINAPRPYVPNMVEVGGLHINRVPNALPENIKRILDNAKHGVIYFSMGSAIQSSLLPADKRDAIVKTFAALNHPVIWKYESDDLPGKSDNVFIQKWMPQSDILAHPNVKLFITHGGLLGTTEAIFHGVPVIGIPIFGDQELNMARATRAEYGITVPYKTLSQESLNSAIRDILVNPKYSKNAKLISKRYRDQPQLPLDNAIYWVEYVARHKGAPHLHSAGQDLNFLQYHNLDVFALILIFFISISSALVFCVRNVCCGKKVPETSAKKEE